MYPHIINHRKQNVILTFKVHGKVTMQMLFNQHLLKTIGSLIYTNIINDWGHNGTMVLLKCQSHGALHTRRLSQICLAYYVINVTTG